MCHIDAPTSWAMVMPSPVLPVKSVYTGMASK